LGEQGYKSRIEVRIPGILVDTGKLSGFLKFDQGAFWPLTLDTRMRCLPEGRHKEADWPLEAKYWNAGQHSKLDTGMRAGILKLSKGMLASILVSDVKTWARSGLGPRLDSNTNLLIPDCYRMEWTVKARTIFRIFSPVGDDLLKLRAHLLAEADASGQVEAMRLA
jgi:hypothetical protein